METRKKLSKADNVIQGVKYTLSKPQFAKQTETKKENVAKPVETESKPQPQ